MLLALLLTTTTFAAGCGEETNDTPKEPETVATDGDQELEGDIVFWHSFTQGPRLESIQKSADKFMEENPKVNITIETFSWNDFYMKWTTGLASGNVPDMSTALVGQVAEMINSEAIAPVNNVINDIGIDKFNKKSIDELSIGDDHYAVPLYSHAMVMWIRKDLMEEHGLEVPTTWDELYDCAVELTGDGVYGLSFPCGTTDFQATNFLNFYVRSGGGSLLTDDLKADLTSDLAIDGINYWLKVYENCSPKDSINYNVLDQATLYYQGKTAFDFNSGFQIKGVEANSPDLLEYVDCYPIPTIDGSEQHGITTSNQPLVLWKNSEHPEICEAFMKTLYEEDAYVEFLHATPVGMLPAIKGIEKSDKYLDNELIQNFEHAHDVILSQIPGGTAIGFEHGPSVQAGILTNQHVIEEMFQDIITNGTDVKEAAQAAEDKLNELMEAAVE